MGGRLALESVAGLAWNTQVFSAAPISYPHMYPHFVAPGTTFTGKRGHVLTRGCDQLGKAGEGDERRIKLRFQALGAAECDSRMHNHTLKSLLRRRGIDDLEQRLVALLLLRRCPLSLLGRVIGSGEPTLRCRSALPLP